jgi:hypothetical protein
MLTLALDRGLSSNPNPKTLTQLLPLTLTLALRLTLNLALILTTLV